jgi:5-hydroxyisourate hydrolase
MENTVRHIRNSLLVCAIGLAATTTNAAGNPLSVHVLDLQSGQPTAGIGVTLEQRVGADWRTIAAAVTDSQGRIPALYPEGKPVDAGEYRIVFKTGEHYARFGQPSFFPRIPVEIVMDKSSAHYHVPLLLSPFGYSTYRGN